jgi:predicted CXXCH cytochrome family protein
MIGECVISPARLFVFVYYLVCVLSARVGQNGLSDLTNWGSDHVGKPLPEYVTGDECLFCHRSDVGPTWSKNRHQLTIREPDAADRAAWKKSAVLNPFADQANLVLGRTQKARLAKKSAAYGKLELLVDQGSNPHWDDSRFALKCAGCHTTAVDPQTHAFAALSLDCFTCHGEVNPEHSKDTRLMYLSRKRHDPARVVISICAQCHVRTGRSRSSGLPYPNNFVAGDNLFRDFAIGFSKEPIERLNPADRHVLENVRDVVVLGKQETTCLSCHSVHKSSAKKHRLEPKGAACLTCHNATGSKKVRKDFEVHSAVCEY